MGHILHACMLRTGLKQGDTRAQGDGDALGSVARNARRAIAWVYEALVQPTKRVRGQRITLSAFYLV